MDKHPISDRPVSTLRKAYGCLASMLYPSLVPDYLSFQNIFTKTVEGYSMQERKKNDTVGTKNMFRM
jgi:hypothetical protein